MPFSVLGWRANGLLPTPQINQSSSVSFALQFSATRKAPPNSIKGIQNSIGIHLLLCLINAGGRRQFRVRSAGRIRCDCDFSDIPRAWEPLAGLDAIGGERRALVPAAGGERTRG
jgi:hypothetical protein